MRIYGLILILVALIVVACSGCAAMPDSAGAELEHVSHPLAGWPVSANNTEDGLSQLNAYARWHFGTRGYIEQAIGYNLQGEGGGGFYGPALTYTGRVGVALWAR